MDSVENNRVSEERAEAGLGAEIDRPAMILDAREICRIRIMKDPSAKRNEAWVFFREGRSHLQWPG